MRISFWMSMIAGLVLAGLMGGSASNAADAAAPWEEHGKLRVSANGRHLEHADGTPMLWIVALHSADGDRILIYLPTNRPVEVKLDLAASKKATARWFDPRDGRETPAGDHACGTTVDFKPPEGWEDAVLVVLGK